MRDPKSILNQFDASGMLSYNGYVNNPFRNLDAALFDLDGTLVETFIDFELMKREVQIHASKYGVDASDFLQLDILAIIETSRQIIENADDVAVGERFRRECYNLLEQIETSHCASPVLIPGASQLLDELHGRNVPIGIVTRNCRSISNQLIIFANLKYDILVTRDDVRNTKPHPDHLLAALHPMLNTRASVFPNSLMVGDHYMDVQAGNSLNMRTVGILLDKPVSSFENSKPDLLINCLDELLPMVECA